MNCEICGNPISIIRLAALPDTRVCLSCSEEPKAVGFMVWDHKTAPYIEIDTATAIKYAGRKHRYGPHIHFNPKEGMYGCAKPMQNAQTLHELAERLRREARNEPDPDASLEPVIMNPARCHPDRPRIGLKGLCLECALEQQATKVKK